MKNFETLAIRIQTERSKEREHSTPIYPTSSFVFNDAEQMRSLFAEEEKGNIYSRYSNPNCTEFQDKICALEGAEQAFATASGMAAVFSSIAALVKSGDHIIASKAIFGSTVQILNKYLLDWGIETTYVNPDAPEEWDAAVQPNSKILFLETPSNPGVNIIDLEFAGKFAAKHNLILNVDNCFATPYIQQPIKYGAHLVTHSATKFIDGQGRVLGGIVAGNADLVDKIYRFARITGPTLSPFNAWVLSKSLETLAIRMDRHSENAFKIATFLESHESVSKVNYPFLPSHPKYDIAKKQMKLGGGILSFEAKGGIEQGRRFLDQLQMCSLSANLGDSRTICTHPASTTHAKLSQEERLAVGITPGLIRVSCGLEHVDDIIKDIEGALK